ncbi:hypothetical protein ACFX15_035214 [Malus domestica]
MALGSTIIHLQDQAPMALGSTIIHLQDQAPTALEESVLRSSFIVLLRSSPDGPLDQQHQQIHTSNRSSRSSLKALGDPFITVLQRSSPKAHLKIRSNPPSRSSPRPLKNVHP